MASTRCGTVVLAGLPNVGKSSLLNALVGERLAIVSPKAQSTRVPVVGVLTRGDAQFIFTDPPGLLTPSYQLQERMREAALRAIGDAEVIAHLHPLPEAPAPAFAAAAGLAAAPRAPVMTVYTKADLVPPERRPPLGSGIAVSSETGEGMEALLDALAERLPPGPFHYPVDELATQPVRFFASEYVREAAFAVLEEELPYSVACEIDEFREAETPTYIRATVYVERESQKGIVIGHQGRTIKAIGQAARARIEGLLGGPVFLDLNVKVLGNWRRQNGLLRRLGYAT
ncbi:MAG TPA: GTPase Era [Gemmatimonadales bacterium]|jgi:GTP-binding protein Era|nr:GTPase Era [Gemmatimonadales bacterium]